MISMGYPVNNRVNETTRRVNAMSRIGETKPLAPHISPFYLQCNIVKLDIDMFLVKVKE